MDERTPARQVLVRARACARVLCVCVRVCVRVYVVCVRMCFLRLRFRVCWLKFWSMLWELPIV